MVSDKPAQWNVDDGPTRRWFTSIGRDTQRRATVSQPGRKLNSFLRTGLRKRAWPGPGEEYMVRAPFFWFSFPEPPVPLALPAKGTWRSGDENVFLSQDTLSSRPCPTWQLTANYRKFRRTAAWQSRGSFIFHFFFVVSYFILKYKCYSVSLIDFK